MPYKYVSESVSLYLRIYATLSGFMGSIYGDGIGISVGHGSPCYCCCAPVVWVLPKL